MHSIILKGVHIGNNVIVGAGSLVNKSIPNDCVVAGNPAKIICDIKTYKQNREQAQVAEASELVQEYRSAFGKDPGIDELAEFFWLFTGNGCDYSLLPEACLRKMRCVGNEELSKNLLQRNENQFSSLDDFLSNI